MSKFRIGDEVVATKRCRERWGSNDFGTGVGVIVKNSYLADKICWVKWNEGGEYFYDDVLLENSQLQENE